MKKKNISMWLLAVTVFLMISIWWPAGPLANDKGPIPGYPSHSGVYINLTEDFYRALNAETGTTGTTYTSRPSDEYLRQISVSTKFMVESNLQILQQQEKIIQLLEAIKKQRK
jgi:hypothetical protein